LEGVLLTMFDSRLKLSNQIVDEVRRYFEQKVFKTVIGRNVRLSEAQSFGKPIILYDAASLGAKHYMELSKEFLSRRELTSAKRQGLNAITAISGKPISSSGPPGNRERLKI